ncbi:MAG: type I DNA topoisomerase, partial [Acholeplasmataceae bacterium]
MKETLIIVESPSKAKTIQSYLGKGTTVLSSVGHIRDLATSGVGGLGIDIENDFTPKYVVSTKKKKVVSEIKKEAKGKQVLIATDQDREGEAIGWHLAQILDLDTEEANRIVFTEITKNTITEAIKHPRKIDLGLVNSQEARRMLDRIIGFKLSGLLQSKLKSKSAGRVQSVALKLIVDLEKEILAFVPETYFEVEATFNQLKASHHHGKERLSKEKADHILNVAVNLFTVSTIDTKENTRKPKAPFTTSTLQQDAYRHLGYSATKTMMLAQMLYEGVKIDGESKGLITYMRSDSTRLSKDFYEPALSHIEANYGKQYVGAYKNTTSSSAQDAHEAIRPTSVSLTPDYVRANVVKSSFRNKDLFEPAMKLYERVYYRTLASLMTPAKLLKTTVTIESNQEPFRIEGIQVIFDGFNKVYDDVRTKDVILPNWKLGETLIADEIISIEKETKPAARFNEGSLIKTLDKLGIGRPSTYASIIKTLEDRQYVTKEENRFKPTEQGILTSDELDNFFKDIINVEYTAEMEDHLDKIAVGEYQRNDILSSFYQTFEPMLEHAKTNMQKVQPEMLDEMCPECGSPLVIRTSRYGKFKGCSNYPTCKYNDIKREKKEPKEVGRDCPKCGKPLVIRTGRKGEFIGCSGFPKCRHV